MEKNKFCLVGETLGHSYSPMIHSGLGDYTYDLCEVPQGSLEEHLRHSEYTGFNITIPYKIEAMSYCDTVSEQAKRIGCVNTVVRAEDGSLSGDNSDYDGFRWLIRKQKMEIRGRKCLILGSGGSSRTVRTALEDEGAREIVIVSRSGENNYNNIKQHSDAEIIVNTTPVGMYPNNGRHLLNLDEFPNLEGALDLIYNPNRTQFILDAMKRGIPAAGGLEMLVAQAKRTSEIFRDVTIDDKVVPELTGRIMKKMMNVVVVGMPGVDAQAEAEEIAAKYGRELVDVTAELDQAYGTMPEGGGGSGSAVRYRREKRRILKSACDRSGLVIVSPAEVVTDPGYYDILKQNSIILWI